MLGTANQQYQIFLSITQMTKAFRNQRNIKDKIRRSSFTCKHEDLDIVISGNFTNTNQRLQI